MNGENRIGLQEYAYEIADEDCASKVLKVAEKKIKYLKSHPIQN